MERQGTLRPQDVIIAIGLLRWGKEIPQKDLASKLLLSPAEIVKSLKRLEKSHLIDSSKKVDKTALLNFIKHGLRIAFPAQIGPMKKGIKTSLSHLGLQKQLKQKPEYAYVWETETGKHLGQSVTPLYPGLELLAKSDRDFYEILSSLEVVRLEDNKTSSKAVKYLSGTLRGI